MIAAWWSGRGIAHAPDGAAGGGGLSWGERAQHTAVRECIASFVRIHGHKRGLHLAAQAIGMGERAARHAYEGGQFAADPERAARADDARFALLNDEIRRLHAEAAQLQHRRLNVAMDRPALDERGGVLHGAGVGRISTRPAMTR